MNTLKKLLTTTAVSAVALAGLTLTAAPAHAGEPPSFLLTNGVVASEGDATTTMVFDMKVTGSHPQAITVGFEITPLKPTPAAADDFAQPLSFTVVVPANVTSVKVPVKVAGDQKIEPSESFLIKPVSATEGTPANVSQKGTITDDDSPRVDVLDTEIIETGLTQKLGVKLVADQPFPGQADVKLEAFVPKGCSATPGADFSLPDVFAKVGFDGGQTERTAFVLISGDDVPEATECFALRVVPTAKVEAGSHGTGRITIFDDEPLPEAPVPADLPKGPAPDPGQPGDEGPASTGATGSDAGAAGTTATAAVDDPADVERDTGDRADRGRSRRARTADVDRSDEVSLADVEVPRPASDSGSPVLALGILLGLLVLAAAIWIARRRRA